MLLQIPLPSSRFILIFIAFVRKSLSKATWETDTIRSPGWYQAYLGDIKSRPSDFLIVYFWFLIDRISGIWVEVLCVSSDLYDICGFIEKGMSEFTLEFYA